MFDNVDKDQDGSIRREENVELLSTMVDLHKSGLDEFLGAHQLSKKDKKLLRSALREQDWELKVAEKIRSVWHFAGEEKKDALTKELYLESLVSETFVCC